MGNNLGNRLVIRVDPESKPVDLDQALARFLLQLVRSGDQSVSASSNPDESQDASRTNRNAPRQDS